MLVKADSEGEGINLPVRFRLGVFLIIKVFSFPPKRVESGGPLLSKLLDPPLFHINL